MYVLHAVEKTVMLHVCVCVGVFRTTLFIGTVQFYVIVRVSVIV